MLNVLDVNVIDYQQHDSKNSSLTVFEQNALPFRIARVFIVDVQSKSSRGFHAHKECMQLLVCLKGKCNVTVDDSYIRKEYLLNKSNQGLLIPATIWAEQQYEDNTILMVLTDKPYDENDYIRNYNQFLEFRRGS